MDPFLSFRLCLEGLHPEDCFIFSFNDTVESELRDLLRATLLLLLLLLLQAAVAVIHSNNIFSIHNRLMLECYQRRFLDFNQILVCRILLITAEVRVALWTSNLGLTNTGSAVLPVSVHISQGVSLPAHKRCTECEKSIHFLKNRTHMG